MRRREVLVLTASLTTLAACSAERSTAEADGATTPQTWSYTSGFDRTVTLDALPERIIADAYSAASLWDYGIRPVGIFGYGLEDDASPLALGDVDLAGIEVVGRGGELNIEALAALEPDLVVGYGTTRSEGWAWWEDGTTSAVANIAPFLAVKFSGLPVGEVIEEYAALAEALGGDRAPTAADEDRYAENLTALGGVAKPELTTIALNGDSSALYVGGTTIAQLQLLAGAGVTFVGPSAGEGEAWAELSWENVPQYPADVLLAYVGSKELFAASPVHTSLPAVRAAQVMEFDDKQPFTYRAYADWLEQVVATYSTARDVTA